MIVIFIMGRNDFIILELGYGIVLFLIIVIRSIFKFCGRVSGRVYVCDCFLILGVVFSRIVILFWFSRRLSFLNYIILIRWVVYIFKVFWGIIFYIVSIRVCWYVLFWYWGGIVGDRIGIGGNFWYGGYGVSGFYFAV